ncbi:hypothetical protein LguiA_032231 [Lonicera macranthoides]
MDVVGKFGNLLTQGVYSVAIPFHPFGGAIDIFVVQQQDGSFRSTPWYVRFGKFQGVLKGAEKIVRIDVNGVESNFHMYLDNSGEAYFIRGAFSGKNTEGNEAMNDSDIVDMQVESSLDIDKNDRKCDSRENEGSDSNVVESVDERSSHERYENLDIEHLMESDNLNLDVVLVSVDGHIITAPISSTDNTEDLQLSTPQFHLGPGEGATFREENAEFTSGEAPWAADYFSDIEASMPRVSFGNVSTLKNDNSASRLEVCREDEEIKENDKDQQEKSPQSRLAADVAEDGYVGESRENSCRVIDLDQKGNIVPIEKNLGDKDDSGSQEIVDHTVDNDKIPEKDIDILVGDERMGDSPGKEFHYSLICGINFNEVGLVVPRKWGGVVVGGVSTALLLVCAWFASECGEQYKRIEISLCGNLVHAGIGLSAAAEFFDAHRIFEEEFKCSSASIMKNKNLVVKFQGKYFPWEKAGPIVLGLAAYNLDISIDPNDAIPVDETPRSREENSSPSGGRWTLWPLPLRRAKTFEHTTSSNSSSEEVFMDSESVPETSEPVTPAVAVHGGGSKSPQKQLVRTKVPTTEQIASLNLKEGQNMVTFVFYTRVLGVQKVEAHIYLWKWNARIVISDVDGTITKSDVLGQFMPLVGKDWTQSGVARPFSAIKENGYQLLFLSARAIVQAYLTRSFLLNLKQDGKALPSGPIVISPDGLFPSLYREVIRRAPHEFKISCLEDIKALFPSDYNPFYAGFGNRDTDELSYRKIGIPKGKIFIINPKGEVAISYRIDVRSYTSLHMLVNDMFPPVSLVEQEDYNSWNYWKMPLVDVDIL